MDGASINIIHESQLDTEFMKFLAHITTKSPATIKSYTQNYKKVREKVGMDLNQVPLEDLVLFIGQMSESYASQKSFANVWSIINHQMCSKDPHPSYIKYYKHLDDQIEIQLRAKHKEIKSKVIPTEVLIKHETELYKKGEFTKFVACFIVRNCYCRNRDLDITVVDNLENVNETDNFIVVSDKNITVIRQDYKTNRTHGRIQKEFTDTKFVNACKSLTIGNKLFPGADNPSKLQTKLKSALYTNEVQYLNSKIDQISKTGNLKELKIVSELRGSGMDHLITSYNLDF